MIPQRITLLTIGASSVPELRAFYQSLEWEETDISSDSYAVFKTAGVLLSIFPIEELEKDAGVSFKAAPGTYKGFTMAINVKTPDEVDSVIETIKKVNGRVLKEPGDAFWGGRTAYFSDPENNLWEVAWNPTAVFDERGAMLSF
ncbi:VOC family protein [Metabacillus sp. RGM 3146]|uniref:VOC family protein n=1 Tax=Metabacillus sp. RGM 3146 TaxID=3401092 RepID=UPI003B9C6986